MFHHQFAGHPDRTTSAGHAIDDRFAEGDFQPSDLVARQTAEVLDQRP